MRTIRSVDFPGEARLVAAGTTIFRVGDPPDCMYSLIEGDVDIFLKEVLVDTIHAGGVFGEMAVIEEDRRAATAVARTDVKIVALDQQQFHELVRRSPDFALRIMRVLSDRVRRLNDRLSRATLP
ncbi:MAG TPA: cyclic nucleotide-binding domain-containing protein [Thermoanaerobaculia bacterium]|nr:cyclic nucleotide-binding domain-containing protein [Thermoanaerobaculia bacterium]